eukprot:331909-Chlamydomonas_euryale.AAC.3
MEYTEAGPLPGEEFGTTRAKVEFDANGAGSREKGLNFKTTAGRSGKVWTARVGPQLLQP